MITNISKNIMGTISFDAKFDGMRKAQDFIVYPIKEAVEKIKIQSDTRFGQIDLATGDVIMSAPKAGGARFMDLGLTGAYVGKLPAEELFDLKANIMATASGKAGTNGAVYVDNSGALEVFAA